jgi:hypothetical protein
MKFALIGAVIGALAAIAASAVTGFTQLRATETAVSAETRREREREDTDATGAARLLASELLIAANYMLIMEGDRLYRRLDPKYRVEVPGDDIRLLFSRLTPNEWGAITIALFNVQGLETFVRSRIGDGKRHLDRRAVRLVRGDIRSVADAIETLKRVAKAEDLDLPVVFYGGE